MGGLISSFTVGRNALKRNAEQSAQAAIQSIKQIRNNIDLTALKATDNGSYNVIRDLITFTGIIKRSGEGSFITPVGEVYERLFHQNPSDAWRWLITRTLWLYTVPNGTQAAVNKVASDGASQFDFFRRFLGLSVALSALSGDERFLSFEELCRLYDDDQAWREEAGGLLARVLSNRANDIKISRSTRSFLDDLEPEYGIPRDNFAALIGKAFNQTGLFEYRRAGSKSIAIALASQLDTVLQTRVRFVIDHPQTWVAERNWDDHLDLKVVDLPEEVSLQPTEDDVEPESTEDLTGMIGALTNDLMNAGLSFDKDLIVGFVAALLAKRFVILTGLTGSGKTKLAQAFAIWLSPLWTSARARFHVGDTMMVGAIEYRVVATDEVAVEFESGDKRSRVILPYGLINEWIDVISREGFNHTTLHQTISEKVAHTSSYGSHFNPFELHLKTAAFSIMERNITTTVVKHYEVISVGPDWTSREACFGYLDALNEGRFVRSTPIIDLILRAQSASSEPFFLILDEMNLSHVERYFADFLSAAESGEAMFMHGHCSALDGVPASIPWPKNLFVIGTINVDETTYMFSPKVLDRANTIEFRVSSESMEKTLFTITNNSTPIAIDGYGARFASSFISVATKSRLNTSVSGWEIFSKELHLLFEVLLDCRAEFGFRTANEIARFFSAFAILSPENKDPYLPLDAQVLQKVLPKLSGSRRRLEGVLCAISIFCSQERKWTADASSTLLNRSLILEQARKASTLMEPSLHPLSPSFPNIDSVLLPRTFSKVRRMLSRLDVEGFTSFSEA